MPDSQRVKGLLKRAYDLQLRSRVRFRLAQQNREDHQKYFSAINSNVWSDLFGNNMAMARHYRDQAQKLIDTALMYRRLDDAANQH